MPVALNETASWGTVNAPAGADVRDSASVRTPMQALTSRDVWLLDRLARASVLVERETLPAGGDEAIAFAARAPSALASKSAVVVTVEQTTPFACTTSFASSDMREWNVVSGVETGPNAIRAVVWHPAGSQFVAVGAGYYHRHNANLVATWSSSSAGGSDLTGVATDGTLLVACEAGGQVFSSSDGISWTPRAGGTSPGLTSVAWGGGAWVAQGDAGIKWSTGGITWTTATDSRFAESGVAGRLAYEPRLGRFIVIAPDVDGWVASINGATGAITWTAVANLAVQTMTYSDAAQGLIGYDGTRLVLSRDGGITWTAIGHGYAGTVGGTTTRRLIYSPDACVLAQLGYVTTGGLAPMLAVGRG